MKQLLTEIGCYLQLMGRVFSKPPKFKMFLRELVREMHKQGVGSLWIVSLISFFIGTVITMQLAINMTSPAIPKFTLGMAAREVIILEFSSTIMCMILAGKSGSSIASEIGTMRVTEQLDAMDIMGVNSANYVILPKVMGMMLFVPVLVIISIFVGLGGGYIACFITPEIPVSEYILGLQSYFKPSRITYSIIKSVVYVFFIASISGYYGYNVEGGALEVGEASTKAVVSSNVMILVCDLLLTQLLLT
ncbi:MAG: ABC transporter permease [Porphyromonas sp.]|nr:ABC transporter permease [Porphyromonas sp.]